MCGGSGLRGSESEEHYENRERVAVYRLPSQAGSGRTDSLAIAFPPENHAILTPENTSNSFN
jgi:hypothetical protein